MTDSTVTFKGYSEDVLDSIFEAVGGNPEDPCELFVELVPANMIDVVCAVIEWVAVFPPIVIHKERCKDIVKEDINDKTLYDFDGGKKYG